MWVVMWVVRVSLGANMRKEMSRCGIVLCFLVVFSGQTEGESIVAGSRQRGAAGRIVAEEVQEIERRCSSCGTSTALLGEVGPDGLWISMVCRRCAVDSCEARHPQPRTELVNLRGRCKVCKRRATFGQASQRPRHCKRHMLHGDKDISNRRCHTHGCGRQPSFGNSSTGVAITCARHKREEFVNLKGKFCRHPEGCTKLPFFGLEGGVPLLCGEHKSPRHVGLTQRAKCQSQGCGKQPTFGNSSSRIIMFCKLHKRQTDVDLRNIRCQYAEGCDKWASYGNTTQPRFCQQHHADGQVHNMLEKIGQVSLEVCGRAFMYPQLLCIHNMARTSYADLASNAAVSFLDLIVYFEC